MKRVVALSICCVLWPILATLEGMLIPFAALYVWTNANRWTAERGIRELVRDG